MAGGYTDPVKEKAWRERGIAKRVNHYSNDEEYREKIKARSRKSMSSFYQRINAWVKEYFELRHGLCDWCQTPLPQERHKWHVDHDSSCHSRWEQALGAKCACIRGLVHGKCNTRYIACLEPLWRSGDIEIKSTYMRDYLECKLGPFSK